MNQLEIITISYLLKKPESYPTHMFVETLCSNNKDTETDSNKSINNCYNSLSFKYRRKVSKNVWKQNTEMKIINMNWFKWFNP